MSEADHYRIRAAKFHTKAQNETDPELRARFENLARAYLRLAEQADRNSETDVVSEPPVPTLLFLVRDLGTTAGARCFSHAGRPEERGCSPSPKQQIYMNFGRMRSRVRFRNRQYHSCA